MYSLDILFKIKRTQLQLSMWADGHWKSKVQCDA